MLAENTLFIWGCKGKTIFLIGKMVEEEPKVVLNARYSKRRVAELLGVNEATVHRMVQRGDLQCGYRRSGVRFYEGREILRAWHAQL